MRGTNVDSVDTAEVDQPIVVQFVNKILADAIHRGATAIRFRVASEPLPHLDPGENPPVDVHYHIDGDYVIVDAIRRQFYPAIANRLRVMAGLDYWKMEKRQAGQIRLTIDGVPVVMSVSFERVDNDDEIVIGIARSPV